MSFRLSLAALAALTLSTFVAAPQASALPAAPGVHAPSIVDNVACRVVRKRVVRPNGRVVWRTVRRCRPGWFPMRPRCETVRERIRRPNGSVVVRTYRRCR